MDGKRPDHSLDTRGSFCPVPIVETDAAMRALSAGQVLEILGDDPGIKPEQQAGSNTNGERLPGMKQEGRVVRKKKKKTGESS